jgi:hypothetical protein
MDWESIQLAKPSCYYLGQYPWHWDYQNYLPMPPVGNFLTYTLPIEISNLIMEAPREEWKGPRLGPYTGTPGVPGVEGVTLENLSEDEFIFYHGKQKYTNYLVQRWFTYWLSTRLKNCIAQKYPPAGWKPKVKVRESGADFDWPGNPIKSLDPPSPMGRRALPPGIEQTTVNISTSLYFSPPEREDGLTLDLEIT